MGDQGLAGARVFARCEPLHGVDEVYHALAPHQAGVFVEERVQPPLAKVGVAGEVFVSDGNVNAVPEVLRLQERQQGIELVPVAGDLTVRRQEVEPVLEVGQVRDDEAVGALDGRRELELYVPGRALAHVADGHVELGQALVVLLHYYERTAHRRALRPHLLQRGLAYLPGKVVAEGEHDHEQQVGHRGDDLGEGYDVHGPYIIRGGNRTQPSF